MKFVPAGRAARVIQSGPFRGIKLLLDLRYETRIFLGLYERGVAQWLPTLCRGIRTAVDVGTSEGLYTCYLLNKTSAETIFAIEPDPAVRELLVANLQLNGGAPDSKRVQFVVQFIGAQETDSACTIDSLGEVATPCFVKMDIEGDEADALRGAKKLLAAGDIRWLIETHRLDLEVECVRILQEAGYQTTIIKNDAWNNLLPEVRTLAHNRWLIATRKSLSR